MNIIEFVLMFKYYISNIRQYNVQLDFSAVRVKLIYFVRRNFTTSINLSVCSAIGSLWFHLQHQYLAINSSIAKS